VILLNQANVPNEATIYLEHELDAETKSEYQLVLTLTDGHLGEGNFITQSMLILVRISFPTFILKSQYFSFT
jgi:cadherin 23